MIAIMLAMTQAGEPTTTAPAADEIVVTAPSEPFAIPVVRLRKAVEAFERDRARFAPQGELWFELKPRAGGSLAGLVVTLADGGAPIPIALSDGGRFRLPLLPLGDGWQLRANRRGSSLALRAVVRSPGFDGNLRRMGDLRLHCRVNWAVQGDRFSFFQRTAFAMVGGCDTRRIAVYFGERRPLAAASLRGKPLPLHDNSFFAPIGVKTVGNDERIALAFKERPPLEPAPGSP